MPPCIVMAFSAAPALDRANIPIVPLERFTTSSPGLPVIERMVTFVVTAIRAVMPYSPVCTWIVSPPTAFATAAPIVL